MGEPAREAERPSLATRLSAAARESAGATLFFHQAVAARLGLNPTDLKCVEIVAREGLVTAGELAERCGLTSGAATTMLDRLEARGFLRRERDPNDRRRVLIRPVEDPGRATTLASLFAPLDAAWTALCERYGEDELRTALDFIERSRRMLEEETRRLTRGTPEE